MRRTDFETAQRDEFERQRRVWKATAGYLERQFQPETGDGHCGARSWARQIWPEELGFDVNAPTPRHIETVRCWIAHTLRTRTDDIMRAFDLPAASQAEQKILAEEKAAVLHHADEIQFVQCDRMCNAQHYLGGPGGCDYVAITLSTQRPHFVLSANSPRVRVCEWVEGRVEVRDVPLETIRVPTAAFVVLKSPNHFDSYPLRNAPDTPAEMLRVDDTRRVVEEAAGQAAEYARNQQQPRSPPAASAPTGIAHKRRAEQEQQLLEQRQRLEAAAERQRAAKETRRLAELAFENNKEALTRLGLPPFVRPPRPGAPPWVGRLRIRVRVVDFYKGGDEITHQLVDYLRSLGATVALSSDCNQKGVACGVVAARVAVDLKSAASLGQNWMHTDVSRAIEQPWITSANLIIADDGQGADGTRFVWGHEVQSIATAWWEAAQMQMQMHTPELPGPPCARCGEDHSSADCHQFTAPRTTNAGDWLRSVTSYDYGIRDIMTDLRRVAATGERVEFAVFVLNTKDVRSTGTHWFTVAYSAELGDGQEPDREVVNLYPDEAIHGAGAE